MPRFQNPNQKKPVQPEEALAISLATNDEILRRLNEALTEYDPSSSQKTQILLQQAIDRGILNTKGQNGLPPFILALQNCPFPLIKQMIDSGQIDLSEELPCSSKLSDTKWTPIMWAISYCRDDILSYALDRLREQGKLQQNMEFHSPTKIVGQVTVCGPTAFTMAVFQGNTSTINTLLNSGFELTQEIHTNIDCSGLTQIASAIFEKLGKTYLKSNSKKTDFKEELNTLINSHFNLFFALKKLTAKSILTPSEEAELLEKKLDSSFEKAQLLKRIQQSERQIVSFLKDTVAPNMTKPEDRLHIMHVLKDMVNLLNKEDLAEGAVSVLKMLLSNCKVDLDYCSQEFPPLLFQAIKLHQPSAMQILLGAEANANIIFQGVSALTYAILNDGNEGKLTSVILSQPNVAINQRDPSGGGTSVLHAVSKRSLPILKKLAEYAQKNGIVLDVNSPGEINCTTVGVLSTSDRQVLLGSIDDGGSDVLLSPFRVALIQGEPGMIMLLLQLEADVTCPEVAEHPLFEILHRPDRLEILRVLIAENVYDDYNPLLERQPSLSLLEQARFYKFGGMVEILEELMAKRCVEALLTYITMQRCVEALLTYIATQKDSQKSPTIVADTTPSCAPIPPPSPIGQINVWSQLESSASQISKQTLDSSLPTASCTSTSDYISPT